MASRTVNDTVSREGEVVNFFYFYYSTEIRSRKMCQNIVVAGILIFLLSSCAYESEEALFGEANCDPDPVTYQAVVKPIMLAKCAIPECNDGMDRSLDNYLLYGIVKNRSRFIKEQIQNRIMPPSDSGVQLTAQEITNIICWIDDGSQNN